LIGTLLIGLTLIMGVTTLLGLNGLQRIVHSLAYDSLAGVSAATKAEADVLELDGNVWRHIASKDLNDIATNDPGMQQLKGGIDSGVREVEKAIVAAEERELFAKIKPALDRYYQSWDRVAVLSQAQKKEKA